MAKLFHVRPYLRRRSQRESSGAGRRPLGHVGLICRARKGAAADFARENLAHARLLAVVIVCQTSLDLAAACRHVGNAAAELTILLELRSCDAQVDNVQDSADAIDNHIYALDLGSGALYTGDLSVGAFSEAGADIAELATIARPDRRVPGATRAARVGAALGRTSRRTATSALATLQKNVAHLVVGIINRKGRSSNKEKRADKSGGVEFLILNRSKVGFLKVHKCSLIVISRG